MNFKNPKNKYNTCFSGCKCTPLFQLYNPFEKGFLNPGTNTLICNGLFMEKNIFRLKGVKYNSNILIEQILYSSKIPFSIILKKSCSTTISFGQT
ncbi:hypothetical protein B0O79_0570 [Flavobacteriaceae bacterium MAR_2009_75]|nr:hypothetical protein B0O79_0570 [Flavobacteriaceae bacterium MAR_2009_75]